MQRDDNLRVYEKLLVAAYHAERAHCPFTAEDLVVSAWENYPSTFGLSGYPDDSGRLKYPDSNRVFAEVMGTKPIRKKGFLVKVGQKRYQLTETGREAAERLLGGTSSHADSSLRKEKTGLRRDVQDEIKRMLTCRASEKASQERNEEITFHDACVFWRINPRSSAIQLTGRLSSTEETIDLARGALREGFARFTHGGESFSGKGVELLRTLHDDLMRRYKEELDVILKRTDERKS